MKANERLRDNQTEALAKWVALAVLMAIGFAVFYALMSRPGSDISIHATWAAEGDFLHPRSFVRHHAHPLWHFFVAAFMRLGLSVNMSGALATTLWKGLEYLAAYPLVKRRLSENAKPITAALCTLCLLLVSSVCVPFINPSIYLGAGTPNTWHSPTQIVVMLFMFLIIPMVARSYDRFEQSLPAADYREPVKSWLLLAALLSLSVIAKPVFLQAFLPAACLFFLVQWIRHPKGSPYFLRMVAAILPCVLLLALQFYFYFLNPNAGTGITVSLNWGKLVTSAVGLLLMQAFPLFVLLTKRPKEKDTLLTLTLIFNAVAFVERLILSELGQRSGDGNFGWALYGASLMLWSIMLPRFISQWTAWRQRRTRTGAWRYGAGFALLMYHLLSGLYYIIYLLTTTNAL